MRRTVSPLNTVGTLLLLLPLLLLLLLGVELRSRHTMTRTPCLGLTVAAGWQLNGALATGSQGEPP